ncbi:MAG: NADP oxidoreductase [Candidatus Omnitrophica bacterium]|nr:NADP oxidoreductase [Candidatus Omnitrophota bacterium]
MSKLRLATTWLDGCSGCHMSLLDMDERLIVLAEKVDLLYGPLVDFKKIPKDLDIVLIEGAVSSEDDLKKVRKLRKRSKILVALGDCAVTANVPAMRNSFGVDSVLDRAYKENAALNPGVPDEIIPALLPHARPVREIVPVDVFVPGCPPPADVIFYTLCELVEGRIPDLSEQTRFGK